MNFWPLAHVAMIAGCIIKLSGAAEAAVPLAILLLLPPLLARGLLAVFPITQSITTIGSWSFLIWWATAQLQMIFCRIPLIEELMRLVPGLYSMWLRLWGSQIGRLTFWSPGLRILDRSFLCIGDDVVFGAGVRLNPHVITTESSGAKMLLLAPVVIGKASSIGGYALLTAGATVADNSAVHACALFPPFTEWKDGHRTKKTLAR